MTITCADCGSTQIVPPLPPRAIARCHRCSRVLDRRRWTRSDVSLAAAVATFIMLPPAVMLPLMESTIRNLVYERSRLVSSVPEIYREVWFPFAFGFLFFAFLFPAVRALLQIVVLGSVRWNWRIPWQGHLFRWSEELRIWSIRHLRGTELWSAPIKTMTLHTLAFDLAGRMPEGMVILPGQAKPAGGMRSIYVVLEEFGAGPDPVLVLDARWILRTPGSLDLTHHERIDVPVASLDSAPIATAMSRALATLADRIALSLASQ